MPNFKVAPRVKQTSTTSGTGTLSLDGAAAASYENFSDRFTTGDLVGYCIAHSTADEWEEGIGTVTSGSPWTLARTTVLKSSNADAAVSFSSGGVDVFCVYPSVLVPTSLSLPVTRQNVTSTSETDTSVVVVPANTWDDGTELEFREDLIALNNTGGTVAWTRKLYVNATSVTVLSVNKPASATAYAHPIATRLLRIGADVYRVTTLPGSTTTFSDSSISGNVAAGNNIALVASGVDFTSTVTVKMSMTLATYNATTSYYNTVGAKATLG